MSAIVPLNLLALRVSSSDANTITTQFKGPTAVFDRMPFGSSATQASTGDRVWQPFDSSSSSSSPLSAGIHLHWELPDFFRNATQNATGGDLTFPTAPNRWLVVRSLAVWNASLPTPAYDDPTVTAFLVESDFVSPTQVTDFWGTVRPMVAVPLPATMGDGANQPYSYMGRVLRLQDWSPTPKAQLLPSYRDSAGNLCRLTATTFAGPGFCDFYPECRSVFGFWDTFADQPAVASAVSGSEDIQFKVSYQVVGWLTGDDPLATLSDSVSAAWTQYTDACTAQGVAPVKTPGSFLQGTLEDSFGWTLQDAAALDSISIDLLPIPASTLVTGVLQEIVWNTLNDASTTQFLSNGTADQALWSDDQAEVALGNTTTEALSALIRSDLKVPDVSTGVLSSYEYLLNALQLGLLRTLEQTPSMLIELEEQMHARAFAASSGGWRWTLAQPATARGSVPLTARHAEVSSAVRAALLALNTAQTAYDQARFALVQRRKQLFMDWYRWINMFVANDSDGNVTNQDIQNFLHESETGEVQTVVAAGNEAGLLTVQLDPVTAQPTSLSASPSGSLADAVREAYSALLALLPTAPGWTLTRINADPYYLPTDPVLLATSPYLKVLQRNGTAATLPIRLSTQLVSKLTVAPAGGTAFTVDASSITGLPSLPAAMLDQVGDVVALLGEAALLVPMLAPLVAKTLASDQDPDHVFTSALQAAQGGLSPLEARPGAGIFAVAHAPGGSLAPNPSQTVTPRTGPSLTFTFTNSGAEGWLPDPVGWNAQVSVPLPGLNRVDPFVPMSLVWTAQLQPFKPGNVTDYDAGDLTGNFDLADVDYTYTPPASGPVPFLVAAPIAFAGSIPLSSRATYSLANQIAQFTTEHSDDPANAELEVALTDYQGRSFVSQAMSGFNTHQILRAILPRIPVQNLSVPPKRDPTTAAIAAAATATTDDSWYDTAFNGEAPMLPPESAFAPLRAGFLEINTLEIVDIFGQVMQLTTANSPATGPLALAAAQSLQPPDAAHAGMAFLPPRLLTPARLSFDFLTAENDAAVGSKGGLPPDTPVFGWILPNDLDDSLFFYEANGSPIGSLSIQGGAPAYTTRPNNKGNPDSSLDIDLSSVDPLLGDVMRYLDAQTDPSFLIELMAAIGNSDGFINPSSSAQNTSLSVLIGRPLALTRAVLSLETPGGLLPLSQVDNIDGGTDPGPFPTAVTNLDFTYEARQAYSAASLNALQIPVMLGNVPNLDDGLVGFLPYGAGSEPYGIFYSAFAAPGLTGDLQQPVLDTLQLTLNGPSATVTLLLDPRAAVHATTGLLPVKEISIPPALYARAMGQLEMTFFTAPLLAPANAGLTVPLPSQPGYGWQWITPAPPDASPAPAPVPLKANAVNGNTAYGYSPQFMVEGWLALAPNPANR